MHALEVCLSSGMLRSSDSRMEELKLQDREERKKLVLWKMPFTTLKYFAFEFILKAQKAILRYVIYSSYF